MTKSESDTVPAPHPSVVAEDAPAVDRAGGNDGTCINVTDTWIAWCNAQVWDYESRSAAAHCSWGC